MLSPTNPGPHQQATSTATLGAPSRITDTHEGDPSNPDRLPDFKHQLAHSLTPFLRDTREYQRAVEREQGVRWLTEESYRLADVLWATVSARLAVLNL